VKVTVSSANKKIANSCYLLLPVRRILKSRGGLFVQRVLVHVPFSLFLFLFEFGHFATVTQFVKQLPDEQEGNANDHDTKNYDSHNDPRINSSWTFFAFLSVDNIAKLTVIVREKEYATVHFIFECA